MAQALTIADLRAELDLTLQALGEQIGLSKSQMHEVERTNRASVDVALRIESLSGGRIDAADLSDDVRKARHGLEIASGEGVQATGFTGELSGRPSTGSGRAEVGR